MYWQLTASPGDLDDEISQVSVVVADMQRKVQIANSDGMSD